MELKRVSESWSWDQRAEEYRTIADATADELAKLGYLQLAQYCESMAARAERAFAPRLPH